MKNKIGLTFFGDIFPANLHQTIGFGVANQFSIHYGFNWMNSIIDITRGSNIVLGNLESPLMYDEQISLNSDFSGSFKFAEFLKKCGFNVLSIANNHILEQGKKGFVETISILQDSGIDPIGINIKENSNIVIKKINNVKIGLIAYNSVHDINNPDLYASFNLEKAIEALGEMKTNDVDCKIVSLHWGWHEEYINVPSAETIKIARTLVDNGAEIIVGHHPHVVQPVEEYKGKLIFYSLGNFLFDMLWSTNVRTGLSVKVSYDILTKKLDYELIPIYINYEYTPIINHTRRFDTKMKKYIAQMQQFNTNEDEYTKKRNSQMKFNQYYQRILMKIYLFKNWNKMSKVGKDKYLDKVKKKYSKGKK